MKRLLLFGMIAMILAIPTTMTSCNDSSAANIAVPTLLKEVPKIMVQPVAQVNTVKVITYNKAILPYLEMVVDKMNKGITGYKWQNPSTCNVGLVAQLISGKSPQMMMRGP